MLLGEEHDLRNRIMHVEWNKVENETKSQSANPKVQSAKAGEELPPKCKNCTLEELALLCIVQKNPSVTPKEVAAEIGKSERTVKSIVLVSLSNKMEFCAILQQWPSGVSEGDFSQW